MRFAERRLQEGKWLSISEKREDPQVVSGSQGARAGRIKNERPSEDQLVGYLLSKSFQSGSSSPIPFDAV